jgi:hypothetical protein
MKKLEDLENNNRFEHYHCHFCERAYSSREEAFDCCLKNKNETVESQIFKRLVKNINLPTIALGLNYLNPNAFKGKSKLHKILKKIDKLEYRLWVLTNIN